MITIIMPTYKRNDFLSDPKHPTLNVCKNELVNKLIIVWQNIGEEIPNSIKDNINDLGINDKVEFKFPTKNSLNNRFYPYEYISDCVVSVDDDYNFSEKSLVECHKQWSLNNDLLVGVVPRFVNETSYHGNAANKDNEEKYNVILTGGAMFHKKYLSLYYKEKDNLKLMDELFNGEDIMFNYIHKTHSNVAPLYIHDDEVKTWKRVQGNSIADRAGYNHQQKRHRVYKEMKSKYGDILMVTNKKIIV